MKDIRIYFLCILLVVFLSPVTFAMGGPAPETPEEGTALPQPQTAEVKPAAAPGTAGGDIEKAKADLTSLEAERNGIDDYMDNLNKKIIKATMAKDSKKVAELKGTERAMTERQNKISQKILEIKQKYPDLKPNALPPKQVKEKIEPAETEKMPEEAKKPAAAGTSQKQTGRNIVYHDVVMGDTLMSISRKYFGTPAYYKNIAKLNNINPIGALTQGSSLMIDLNIGGGKVGTVEKTVKKPVPKPSSNKIVYHAVAKGDTLMSISRQYFNGSPFYFKEIAEMNGITELGQLKVGMKLKIDTSLNKKPKPRL